MLKIKYSKHLFLSYDPLITAYIGAFNEHPDSVTPALPAGLIADVILEHVSWNISLSAMQAIKTRYDKANKRTRRLLVVNSQEEELLRRQLGVDGFKCGHDAYIPDYEFTPCEVPLEYDAIYTARLSPYKRHYLASKVKNARMLTGGVGVIEDLNTEVKHVDSSDVINVDHLKDSSVCFDRLDTQGVCAEINKSCCGLALSAVEGMMTSSSEYLLCGRPVVSTKSRGGRDMFYNDTNSIVVEDDAEAVSLAVQHWVDNPPDSMEVRANYMSQLSVMRYAFARKISNIQLDFGRKAERPERIFHDLFIDQLAYKTRLLGSEEIISNDELSKILTYSGNEAIFIRNDQYSIRNDGAVCFLEGQGKSLKLDELAGWIFTKFDGKTTVSAILKQLIAIYGEEHRIGPDVRDTIEKLLEFGVVIIAEHTLES